MKEQRLLIPILLIIALTIWGWNGYRLFHSSRDESFWEEETLPEVPLDLLEDMAPASLPDLKRDPFFTKTKPIEAGLRKNSQSSLRVFVPRGSIQMILKLDKGMEAVFLDGSGQDQRLTTGAELGGEWRVKDIQFDRVLIEHTTGKQHEYLLR